MKTMSAREAKNAFGTFLDTAQREPVVVTKHDRPVGVMFSMDNFSAMADFVDSARQSISAGILQGLEEANAGKGRLLDDKGVSDLKSKLEARLSNPQTS